MKAKKIFTLAMAAVLTLALLAGCGAAAPAADPTAAPAADAPATEAPTSEAPAALSGSVSTNGSTSMEKVVNILAEQFMNDNPGVSVTYDPTGSGTGIESARTGSCDIGLASRALKTSKTGLTGTVVALDGIAIIVNKDCPVDDLTIEQIAAIFKGEIKNWNELGGEDLAISCVGRESGSGTRDGFESITETADACVYRQELTSTGDVIATVSQNPDAIGYASLASVGNTVSALSVGGVSPTEDTVKDGSYVIQRPFCLITKDGVTLSEAAQAFFDYITSSAAAEIISAAGAVPAI